MIAYKYVHVYEKYKISQKTLQLAGWDGKFYGNYKLLTIGSLQVDLGKHLVEMKLKTGYLDFTSGNFKDLEDIESIYRHVLPIPKVGVTNILCAHQNKNPCC